MIYDKNSIITALQEAFGQVATLIEEAEAADLEKIRPE